MRSDEFDMEFEEKFELEKKGYSEDKIQFAKSAMSNMIGEDRKSTRLNSSHPSRSRMPSSA